MSNFMHYKGYDVSIEFSNEDDVFYGKVEGICSLISFEGVDVVSLRNAFKESIDDYLEVCKKRGIESEKPYKGSFNVRVGVKLHRELYLIARKNHTSINKLVKKALEHEYVAH